MSESRAASTPVDLDRVREIADEFLTLGVHPDALRPIHDWLAARRAEQVALDPDVQYDDEPITVCGQVITFPHYASPHDPKYANEGRTYADGQPCNRDCPGQYPCAVRCEQRETLKWLAEFLRGALYQRTGGNAYAEWTGPLGRRARYGQTERGMWAQVLGADGKVDAESLDATPEWLSRHV